MEFLARLTRIAGVALAALGAAGFYMHYELLAAPQYTLLFRVLVLGASIFCLVAGLALIFLMRFIMVAIPLLAMYIAGRMGGQAAGGGFGYRGGGFGGPFG